jgi:phosphoribosylformylglycinamidine synthase
MVKSTLPRDAASNSVIAFHDNSSALRGCEGEVLLPVEVGSASPMQSAPRLMHPILTAETHNFPR